MNTIYQFVLANQYWILPLAIYLALNLAKRDCLVNNSNPVVRGVASVLEKILVLEWGRWGGSFKSLGIVETPDDNK